MFKRFAHLSVGLLPLGLGAVILVEAMVGPSGLVHRYSGLRSIGINSALCYVAAGAAILCHPFVSSLAGKRVLKLLALAVAAFAAIVLVQQAFDIYPSGAFWGMLLNVPFPQLGEGQGGMSLTAAISFLALGIALFSLPRVRNPLHGIVLLALAMIAFTLSMVGVFGHVFGLDVLFSETPGSLLMSGPASWAMAMLAAGVIYLLVRGGWFEALFAGRADRRLFFYNLVFLVALTLMAGIVGIGLFEREAMRNYRNSLSEAVLSDAQLLEGRIMRAISSVTMATVVSEVDETLGKASGSQQRQALQRVSQELLKNLWEDGVRMVRLSDRGGKILGAAGEEMTFPQSGLPVAFPNPVRLYWMDGWWVDIQVLIVDGLQPVGRAQFQVRLAGLDMHLTKTPDGRNTGRVRVCTTEGNALRCLPGTDARTAVSQFMVEEVASALSGKHGAKLMRTGKGASMVAYAPVGTTGLGMVHGVRSYELFYVLRVQLLLALAAMGGIIFAGALVFYRRVYPAVREIQFEKTRTQEILCHIPEGVVTTDGSCVIRSCNPAMEHLFGYSSHEIEGRRITQLIPDVCQEKGRNCKREGCVLESRASWGELKGVRRDGSQFPVELAFNGFQLDGKKYFIGIVRDVAERRAVEEDLRRRKEQYHAILETAMDGFFVVNATGQIQAVNAALCHMLRYSNPEEVSTLTIADIEAKETSDEVLRHMDLMRKKGGERFESRWRRKDGRIIDVEVSASYEPDEQRFYCFVRDITKRKRAENALKRSLASLADAQRLARLGDWEWEISSDTLLWSEEVYRIFGLESQQLIGSMEGFFGRVHPDDRDRVKQAIRISLDERRPFSLDHRIVLPNGEIRVVHELAEVVFDKKWRPIRMRGTLQDISDRKRIEDDLEHSRTLLRKLAVHIETVRENEKGRIAREIHDELGQLLTALRMDASLMRIQFGTEHPALKEKLESMTDLVDRTIRVVRSVASNLRPSALEVGIVPAIDWLVEDFQKRSGIMLHFKRFDRDLDLDERLEITVFRIMQESLTNVARYANASRVEITVAKLKDEFLWVEVQDNGKGFELDKLPPHKAFGLMGIRERAISLGGECIIDSAPGAGTSIAVQLPLAKADA